MYHPAATLHFFYRTDAEKTHRHQVLLKRISEWEEGQQFATFPIQSESFRDGFKVYHDWDEREQENHICSIDLFTRVMSDEVPINVCLISHRAFFKKLVDTDVVDIVQYYDISARQRRKWLFFKTRVQTCIGKEGFVLIEMIYSILPDYRNVIEDQIGNVLIEHWMDLKGKYVSLPMTKEEGKKLIVNCYKYSYCESLKKYLDLLLKG